MVIKVHVHMYLQGTYVPITSQKIVQNWLKVVRTTTCKWLSKSFYIYTCRAGYCSMRSHETSKLGAMMIRTHEQLTLIFITAGITCSWLCCSCQTLEVKLVGISLAMYLCHYILVVVVSEIREKVK